MEFLMHIQRIRPNEIQHILSYFVLMNCTHFERDKHLDQLEENLLNYLKHVSTFTIMFWHTKKELRKSAKAVAINGLDQIAGATQRHDKIAIRQHLKECMIAYLRLAFGEDFIELLEREIELIVGLMGDKSYEEFTSHNPNLIIIGTQENNVLVEGTKLNMINH